MAKANVKEDWRINPVDFKIKWKEEQISYTLGGGGGYYLPDFRWTSTFRWKSPTSTNQPAYFKTSLRRRIIDDWWVNAAFGGRPHPGLRNLPVSLI